MASTASAFRSRKGEAEYLAAYAATMRLWTVPYLELDLPTRFGRTHVLACGPASAAPLILLHSFFMSSTVWAYNVADLSRAHRVYAVDMVGQPGKSVPADPVRTREEMAEWLAAVLDGLGIPRTDMVGWSYGGFAALNFAIRRPERVRRLVLLTPIGSFVPLRGQFYLRGVLTRLPGRFWSRSMMRWFTYGPNLSDQKTRQFFDVVTNQFYPGVRHFRLPATVLPTPFTDDELARVTIPTLLLIGEEEALYDAAKAIGRAKQLVLNIETELVPEAGHELPASQPEMIDTRVLEFLKAARA